MCLALRAWRTMAPLRYAAKFDPFLSLDCARVEGGGSNFAICQHWPGIIICLPLVLFRGVGRKSIDCPKWHKCQQWQVPEHFFWYFGNMKFRWTVPIPTWNWQGEAIAGMFYTRKSKYKLSIAWHNWIRLTKERIRSIRDWVDMNSESVEYYELYEL